MLCFYYTVGFPRSATVLTQRLVDQGRQAPPAQWPAAHRVHSLRLQRGRARGAPRPALQPAPPAARRRSLTRSSTQPAAPAAARASAFPRAPLPPAQKVVARPQSHFLSQSYETILSTSLTVHSLYRPELVQLEDLLRFLVRRAPIQPRCVASHDVGFTGRGTPSPDAPQRVGPPALVR